MEPAERAGSEHTLISVQVRTMATGNHNVTVASGAPVSELKALLVRPTGLPVERQRIIYSGRVLDDSQTLSSGGVHDGHTLHLVEQDPSQYRAQQGQGAAGGAAGADAAPLDAAQLFQSLFGGAGGAAGGGVPGVNFQAVQMGPFTVGQDGFQQMAAALGSLGAMPMPGGAPPPAAGAAAGGAAAGGASPFNFGNIFGGGGRGGRGRGGAGHGGRHGAAGAGGQNGWNDWLNAVQQQVQQYMMGAAPGAAPPGGTQAHVLDGLDRMLRALEQGQQAGVGDSGSGSGSGSRSSAGGNASRRGRRGQGEEEILPSIHLVNQEYMDALPAELREAWAEALPAWQRGFVAAARSVLDGAQLSSATRAAVNRVLEAAGEAPIRLTAEGGSSMAERRVRSFPVFEGGASDGEGAEGGQPQAPPAPGSSTRPGWRSIPPRQSGAASTAAAAVQPSTAGPAAPGRRAPTGAGAAAAAPGLVDAAQGSEDVPGLVGGSDSDGESEWETDSQGGAGEDAERDGLVEDYHSSEGEEEEEEGVYGDLPPLLSGSDTEKEEEEARRPRQRRRTGAAAPAAPARHQQPLLPLPDTLLLGAVALGELVRRFLLLLGGSGGSGGQLAATWAAAERLRGLAEVPTAPGAARDELAGAIRLLASWLLRLSASAAELMRALQYLGSGVEQGNVWITRAVPGYLALQGESARAALPRPVGAQMTAVPAAVELVVAQGTTVPIVQQAQQAQQARQGAAAGQPPGPNAFLQALSGMFGDALGGQPGQPAGAAPAAGGAAQQPPVVRFNLGPPGQQVPAAVPIVAVPPAAASGADAADGGMPPEVASMAQLVLRQLGVDPAGQAQMLTQFDGMMQALRQSSVGALDVPGISRDVASAVQRVLSQESAGLRAALSTPAAAGAASGGGGGPPMEEAAGMASRLVPAITGEVQRVLSEHVGRLRSSPVIEAFMPYLAEMGITVGEDGPQQGAAGAEPAAAAHAPDAQPPAAAAPAAAAPDAPSPPAAAPAPAPAAAVPPASAAATPGAALAAPPAAAPAPAASAAPPARPPAPASSSGNSDAPTAAAAEAGPSSSRKPAPAGLGKGLHPRKPAKKEATAAPAAADAPAESAGATAGAAPQQQQHQEAQAEQPAGAAPSAMPAGRSASGRISPDLLSALSSQLGATGGRSASRAAPAPGGGAPARDGGPGTGPDLSALTSLLGGAAGSRAPAAGGGTGPDLSALTSLLGGAGGGGGGGGGGGLMGMLQGVMGSPGLMEMAQSPAMQRMAEQMFSGGAGGGAGGGGAAGGGGLAGMMNAMGPMMGELLGGLGSAGGQPGSRGGGAAQPPASLDEVLSKELPPEEAARWKQTMEADEEAQRTQQAQQGFSDAYLAALPPRAAAGLLQLVDDDEEDEGGAEEVASGDGAAQPQAAA